MSLLKEMGIQAWRLRSGVLSENEVISEPAKHATSSEVSEEPHVNDARGDSDLETQTDSKLAVPQELSQDSGGALLAQRDDLQSLDWRGMQALIDNREYCPTCEPGNSLLGTGSLTTDWVFVTDAPASADVQQDALFSGRAGALFEAMLSALGLQRSSVYTTSVFKCAPTGDLSASPQCDRIVLRQLELLKPKVVVVFGEFSSQAVLKTNDALEKLRLDEQRCFRTQLPVVPTYSPAQMLDDPALKAKVWKDLKKCLHIVNG